MDQAQTTGKIAGKCCPKSLDRRGPIKNTESDRAVCTSLVWIVVNQIVLLTIQQTVLTVHTEDRMTSK